MAAEKGNRAKIIRIAILLVVVVVVLWMVMGQLFGTHPLEGEPAPTFTAPMVGGGEVDLAAHLGVRPVVLDFWATWCPPCRDGLPKLAAAEAAHEATDLVVLAVNIREEEQDIVRFLRQANLSLSVVRDIDGAIATQYEVSAIPMMVFIGRDGIINAITVGSMSEAGLSAALARIL